METANLEPNDTECPVCHEYYKEPKILPCAHLLCHKCLVSWMKTNKNAQCPLCLGAIVDPQNRTVKTCDDVANQLPTDDVMSEMVDSIKIFSQTRVCYVHKDMNAKSFCLHCRIMLCTTCAEVHATIPATSYHQLEDQEKLTLEILASSRQSPCSVHPDKASEHYCVVHDILICNECAVSKHRACPEVPNVHVVLEKNKRSLSEMEYRLSAVESALRQVLAEIEERFVSLEQNTKDSITQIDTACDRLVSSIENCRKRLKKLVQDEHDRVLIEVNKQKDALGQKRGLIISHVSLIHRIQLSASCTSLASMVPRLNRRVSAFDQSAPLLSNCKPLTTPTLTIDEKTLSRIEMELARVGQLHVSSSLAEKRAVWRFHPHHGRNIVLTNNDMTAESNEGYYGMVFSSEPIIVNMLYEVRVDETDALLDGRHFGFGVITENPTAIPYLPLNSTELLPAIIVFGDAIYFHALATLHNVHLAYKTITVGSRIGVVVDAAQCLHIYVDGKDQGVVCRDVHLPCFAIIDFCLFLKKVTILPLTSVPCALQRGSLEKE